MLKTLLSAPIKRSTSSAASRAMSSGSFKLPELTYDVAALEPTISAQIMTIHHSKHHATYVNNLNVASEKLADAQARGDISAVIALQGAIKFNGGGHLNHSIFWQNLAPPSEGGGVLPAGSAVEQRLEQQWGSVEAFKTDFAAQTVAVQGSGWGWLGYDASTDRLAIATCANQDPLQATTGLVPLLGIDVWEHAYYLDYKNVRPDYVKSIWAVVNWADVNARLQAAAQK